MTIKEVIKHLRGYSNKDSPCAFALWLPDDVIGKAEEMGRKLTDEQAAAVLERVDHNMDANVGINWDVLEYWISEIEEEDKAGRKEE